MNFFKKAKKGFTLVELLAVITIMGILMLVAIPAVSRTIENSRRDTFMDTAKAYINSDSTSWGNYSNSSLTLKSGKYNTSPSSGTWKVYNEDTPDYVTSSVTAEGKSILLTTGATEYTNKMNIYDFAGNANEWTLEKTTDSSNPCAYRGGSYGSKGSIVPASSRSIGSTTYIDSTFGFRVSLY